LESVVRIWATVDGVEKQAYKVDGVGFDCYPPSTNLKANAETIESIEDAAVFLLKNMTWGVRMNPGSAIIYRGIHISR
jgi:hypothetical protein